MRLSNIAVFGGGAAGYFAAISAARAHPGAQVSLFEKSDKVLGKVRISGGGRCNVTHAQHDVRRLAKNYPRGERFLKQAFSRFAVPDTVAWFQQEGVSLKVEPDGRMFPSTDDSETIVRALQRAADRAGVKLHLHAGVRHVDREIGGGFVAQVADRSVHADRIIVTTGGHPKAEAYAWLQRLGHRIVAPVPSLFTFNVPDSPIRELMGVAVPARVRIVGTDLESTGPLLITHWGFSGPAVLRLSAWGARQLNETGYRFTAQVNWLHGKNEEQVRTTWKEATATMDRKQALNADPFHLPRRLWEHQLHRAGIAPGQPWGGVAKKERNRLVDLLTNDRYAVVGKTTFKEEFVTAGGVALDEVDPRTMQSIQCPGLYFAGEVLDLDGITGGFNFQAAWTTGHIAGLLEL